MRRTSSQRGLSLVEILVGVAIGVIGVLAIFQTVAVWNRHTQTTSAGGDAQTSGTLALFNLERDLKQAGHGFGRADVQTMGCTVNADDATPARAFTFGLQPVEIVFGAAGAPDQINVLYGDSSFYVDPVAFTGSTSTSKTLRRRGGFHPGDIAVVTGNPGAAAGSATCQLVEITADTNPDGYTVDHVPVPGAYASFYAASGAPASNVRYNPAGGTGATFSNGTVFNLGPLPTRHTWRITYSAASAPRLIRTDVIRTPAADFEIADGVINLKAQYGYDADSNGQISGVEWAAIPFTPPDWTRILAIRVAVLVRSRQFERSTDSSSVAPAPVTPTSANPRWAGGNFLMTNVDGTPDSFSDSQADPNNWRYYRYRVYERVIPLRNVLWGNWN